MARFIPEAIIIAVVVIIAGCLYILNQMLVGIANVTEISSSYGWIVHVILNIVGYSTIFIPAYIIKKYVKATNYLEKSGNGCFPSFIQFCLNVPDVESDRSQVLVSSHVQRSTIRDSFLLFVCFTGLQTSYLMWGLLQEKVMTKKYVDENNIEHSFDDSQFLVFVNRILAFIMSGIYIYFCKQSPYKMPFYKYSYCSFSNIMSSWCQYEALKYVSFPTQVLAKASKVIPVMVMGKIVSRAKYEHYEYGTALMMSIGMIFFMLEASVNKNGDTATTFSGLMLLTMYIVFDSFTSNWQGTLFKQYGMSSVQMMFGVNTYSCLFTAVSLIQQGELFTSLQFMIKFPKFTVDCLLLSICSAAGQLLIYYTIATFGPVTFVIIMTIRQGLAILLSCLIYQHHINVIGIFGIVVVFLSVFLRVYFNQRRRRLNNTQKV